ncbi:MAG: hypothetical protein WC532_04080 [Candidatus Omnitrophota bacterium]
MGIFRGRVIGVTVVLAALLFAPSAAFTEEPAGEEFFDGLLGQLDSMDVSVRKKAVIELASQMRRSTINPNLPKAKISARLQEFIGEEKVKSIKTQAIQALVYYDQQEGKLDYLSVFRDFLSCVDDTNISFRDSGLMDDILQEIFSFACIKDGKKLRDDIYALLCSQIKNGTSERRLRNLIRIVAKAFYYDEFRDDRPADLFAVIAKAISTNSQYYLSDYAAGILLLNYIGDSKMRDGKIIVDMALRSSDNATRYVATRIAEELEQ